MVTLKTLPDLSTAERTPKILKHQKSAFLTLGGVCHEPDWQCRHHGRRKNHTSGFWSPPPIKDLVGPTGLVALLFG